MLQDEITPPLTANKAVALLILYTVLYVAPFYLSPLTRPSPTLSRDAPSVIRARITSVTLTCTVCCTITFLLLVSARGSTDEDGSHLLSVRDAVHMLGVWPIGLHETACALLLTAGLFLGPLFECLVVERDWWQWVRRARAPNGPHPLHAAVSDWVVWRNLVAGPFTEEVLFRAAAVPLLLVSPIPVRRTVLLSPVVFGLAHLHHAYEFSVTHPQTPKAVVTAHSLLQFAYTTLFGCYATFVYIRTGSLLAVCAVHSFCNCMGLPRFWGRVQKESHSSVSNGDNAPRKGIFLWTLSYYSLLVVGAIYWYRHLWLLTESPVALATF